MNLETQLFEYLFVGSTASKPAVESAPRFRLEEHRSVVLLTKFVKL